MAASEDKFHLLVSMLDTMVVDNKRGERYQGQGIQDFEQTHYRQQKGRDGWRKELRDFQDGEQSSTQHGYNGSRYKGNIETQTFLRQTTQGI